MKKLRGKAPKPKKYVSVMLVPHDSNNIKTWKISNLGTKFFSLIAFFMLVLLILSGCLALVIKENRKIREEQALLHDFFIEQQDYVMQNITTIEEVRDLDNISKEKLYEFSLQVQDITRNYIEKEMKTLSISRSSALTDPSISFVGKIAELKAVLNYLNDANNKEDELFAELSKTREELENYLDHLPTLWPTEGIIESGFGRRLHPVYRWYHDHTGVDIGGKSGNPIYATASGTVIFAGKNGGYGNCVDISHGNGLVTRYAHCSKILVKKWQTVKVGQEIAKVGQTGTATGPHLHFEILLNNNPINPTIFIGTKP
ncbi:MAG: M23 family metallopeptidase [Clostridiaceae bacterium]|nr:M23 family metallopeptidase [Clostridiaceae bacterium]